MKVYFSNKVERLYAELKGNLFLQDTSPFTRRYVIVPSSAMKHWLMTALADDPEVGISAGIKIINLEQAERELVSNLAKNPDTYPKKISETQLAIHLEVAIRHILQDFAGMANDKKNVWAPLVHYLLSKVSEKGILNSRHHRRILSLSSKLASLFITYGKYGTAMLEEWQKPGDQNNWQKELWRRCVNEVSPREMEWKNEKAEVHLFSISFLSAQQHRLISTMSNTIPVYYYLLSPCQVFWTDIQSDRECKKLVDIWQKRGAPQAKQQALEEFLYDRNSLLANLGKLGREMALEVEKSNLPTWESYVLPAPFKSVKPFCELVTSDMEFATQLEKISLLSAIQADLLLMRNPAKGEKLDIEQDRSIQLHISSSPMREIQSLYDIIIGLIQSHKDEKDPLLPEDIIVMAPDMMKYEPYIRAVFAHQESRLDFQLMDLNVLTQKSLIQGFMHLISLAKSRWDVTSVMQLFDNPPFQLKQGLSLDDISKIKSWIKAIDVRWGEDPGHRQELLNREFEHLCRTDMNPAGTWNQGFKRLMFGMAMILPEDSEAIEFSAIPLNLVDNSQAPLFGKWIQLMRSLKKDLQPLIDGSEWSLSGWSSYLKELLQSYFDTSFEDESDEEESETFQAIMDSINVRGVSAKESFSFPTILFHLEAALKKHRLCYRESHLHAVKFCSMLPMRAIPSKAIILIGMGEENYPRREIPDSLNMLKKNSKKDYYPTQTEFDRYLLLETILSARKYFILSYSYHSQKDGNEQPPSLLISELFDYLDRGYTLDGQKPSEICQKRYPFKPYDKSLFFEGTLIQSYSRMYFKAAQAFYSTEEKTQKHCFVPDFVRDVTKGGARALAISHTSHSDVLDIRKLTQMARNPIEAYLKQRLGMYLNHSERDQRNEEDFVLSNLMNGMLKKYALRKPLENILNIADKQGKLPLGPFREYSLNKLSTEFQEIKNNLSLLNITSENIFDVHLSERFKVPKNVSSGDWQLPPLECKYKGKKIQIVGRLPDITEQGLIAFAKKEKSEALKYWPQYLVYSCLKNTHKLPFENGMIFAKDGKKMDFNFCDVSHHLERYLHYYYECLDRMSPLIPEWIPDILENDVEIFEKKMRNDLFEKNPHFYNNDMKWIVKGSRYPDPEIILGGWRNTAQELFGELLQNFSFKAKPGKG